VVALEKHVPSKVLEGTAMRVGHYNPEQKLRLVLTIQAPHMPEEEQFIKELVTKGSPNFHKFLTLDQWNARFGPSVQSEQAVVDWAESVGLTVTKRYSDRLIVDVEGTAGTIEKAFGVTINNYQVGDEVDFSNDRDPIIPANLSGILSFVTGLSNVERPHRLGSRNVTVKGADYVPGPMISEPGNAQGDGDPAKALVTRPAAMTSRLAAKNESSSPSNPKANDNYPLDDKSGTYAMDPSNVQSSNGYDFNALQRLSHCCNEPGAAAGSPPESSIALVGYGGFLVSDVSTFAGAYGMAYNLSWYCIGGGSCPGNDGEAPLDVEYSMAMSNSYGSYLDTAHIFEYEMTNGLYTTYESAFNDIVSDGHAKVVSTSYGWEENVGFSGSVATGTMHPIFNTMVGTGITLIAASGDNGASDGCGNATAVDYPSSDPDFIAAGGTQLNMYTNGVFYSETAWQGESWSGACGSNHGGSTGGVSVLFAAPSWQKITNSTYPQGVVSPFYLWKGGGEYVETGNGNRMVPDISLTANPDVLGQWYVSGGSWQDEGGTSIVAPELAGFFAQENSYLDYIGNACGGSGTSACSPIGNAAPFIYQDAIYGAPHDPFYDMVSGCSNNDVTAAYNLFYYCAYTGYDPITGWGSANMMQLAWGINWWVIPAVGSPSLSFGGPSINTWYNSDQIVDWDLNDSGGSFTAPGAAGFTLAWDSIPSDSYSKPHGGDGDTFYTGPEYAFSTFGCVDNNGTYCQAASGQGCHTVYVRGWDNQGNVTNGSYGPVCFDSVAPTITASTNPATSGSVWVDKSVVVTLTPTDPGGSAASGIQATYYAINTGACYPGNLGACTLYTGPFTVSGQQQSYIYYFTEDYAGNFSTEPYIWVSIDETAPTTTASLSGPTSGGQYYSTVQVTLSATDTGGSGVANTYYKVDGGAKTTYSGSAFTVSGFANHTVKYWSVDSAGNVETTKTVSFTVSAIPVVSVSPTSLTFPSTVVGATSASQSITLTNIGSGTLTISSVAVTGTNASSFAFGSSCGTSLAAGANCTIHGHFAPTAAGALTAAVSITDNASGSPHSVALSGTGIAAPAVSLSATSLTFGSEPVGTSSASQSVTLTNTGGATLTISSIAVTGTNASSFAFGNSCGASVASGASCTIHGHFDPTAAGALTAAITITDNGAGSPQSITLTGTGVNPAAVSLSATSLSFGSEPVGTSSASQSVTLTNTGGATLTISSIAVTGTNASSFAFGNSCGASVASGASCTIHGHFSPTVLGALTAAITITDNAAGSPQSITLTGTGVNPAAVSLSATSLSFGSEPVGTSSSSQSVTLTNTGGVTLTITSIAVTGTNASSFVFGNSCGTSVASGASCTIHGHFNPTATGALTAAITITDNAAGSPQSIALTGTGQ